MLPLGEKQRLHLLGGFLHTPQNPFIGQASQPAGQERRAVGVVRIGGQALPPAGEDVLHQQMGQAAPVQQKKLLFAMKTFPQKGAAIRPV